MYKPNRLNSLRTLTEVLLLTLAFFLVLSPALSQPAHINSSASPVFHASAAMAYTRRATSFGERPSGSPALVHLREWIISELKPLGAQLTVDSFTGETPDGPIPMANIILKFPGESGKAVVISGHYDTKKIPMVHFVGANDAGSSTGFLVEFAKAVSAMKHQDDLYIVFFDGEEAVRREWTDADSRYGSRHLVAKWLADGTLPHIKALINIDMIGDRDLDISDDENSSQSLKEMVWHIAGRLGDAKYFRHDPAAIDDDHKPFVDAGVNAIDIIDLDYGPNGSYWHTAQDTLDKLSVHSFQIVGNVVLDLVKQLEAEKD